MSDSTKILTHQGKDLRLSLPANDCRQEHSDPISPVKQSLVALEPEFQANTQTIDIFSDICDVSDMRVVCSISDRIQWDQRVRQVRERRLQELGVGIVQNRPAITVPVKNKPLHSSQRSTDPMNLWTGLHTPAISTVSSITSNGPDRSNDGPGEQFLAESLTAQVEALRARHHQLSQSVSQLASTSVAKPMSRRELVHQRLGSITPIIVRSGSRVVSGIESIKEVPEESDMSFKQNGLTREQNVQTQTHGPLARNPAAFHQHLASHDMSELIKPRQHLQGDLYLPDFEAQYESFQWADEPMDSENPAFTPIDSALFGQQHLAAFDFEPVSMQPPQDLQLDPQLSAGSAYFYPQSIGPYVNPALYNTPAAVGGFQAHIPQKSSLNLQAQEFVPFSRAVIRPPSESHAIPIVRPSDVLSKADSIIDADFELDASIPADEKPDTRYDAYDGFDSSSDASEEETRSDVSVVSVTSAEESNEQRVKSFKFPSPCKPGVVTPARSRTDLFNSASPEGFGIKLSTTLPPPKMCSTPRKSPKIFQKSVALEDTELDSIIMDLSVREANVQYVAADSDSDQDSDEILFEAEPEDYTAPKRPILRRASSAKLLLSHQDTDVGLLLDAMLSAKFASMSEVLTGVQGALSTVGAQMQQVSTTLAQSQTQAPVWHTDIASMLQSQQENELAILREQSRNYAHQLALATSEAKERAVEVDHLRQELWTALAEVKAEKSKQSPEDGEMEAHDSGSGREETSAKAHLEDLIAKSSRLEGQLRESTAFCGALQSQYTASELAVTKLKKELSDVQVVRDQALSKLEEMDIDYERLQQHLQETSAQFLDEQSRLRDLTDQKESEIEELMRRLNQEQGLLRKVGSQDKRRTSSISSDLMATDSQLTQYMMDRVKALEYSLTHLQVVHKQELERRDDRVECLLEDWKQMTSAVAGAESTIDGLRAEIVMNADVEDRLRQDLDRAHGLIDALTMQLGKGGPIGILKRSKSASEVRNESLADQAIIRLTNDIQQRDILIARLEALLGKPAESTERQILSAISENIAAVPTVGANCGKDVTTSTADDAQKLQAARVAELKRMRMSWELHHAPEPIDDAIACSRLASGPRLGA